MTPPTTPPARLNLMWPSKIIATVPAESPVDKYARELPCRQKIIIMHYGPRKSWVIIQTQN